MLSRPSEIRDAAWRTSPDVMVGILLVVALTASSSTAFAAWLADRAGKVSR